MDPPYIYEDLVQHRFYVVAADIRTRIHVPHQHPNQPEDQVVPVPVEEHVPEPIPEWHISIEHNSVYSCEPSSEELHTTSITGPTSVGQSSSTSVRTTPDIIEISDDDDEDPKECSNVIEICSNDDS
ncbi:hypothetical protein AHAS_Ahas20G0163200 [Arachis hypogaea]